jgi:galactokinase
VATLLQRQCGALCGFDAVLESTIPRGGGLSSSAALEAVIGLALAAGNGINLGVERMARLCQQAEHEFAGVPCGIMDQMAVLGARAGELLLLDCENNATAAVPFGGAGWSLLIINSGVAHENAAGEYGARRRTCEEAASRLGVKQLRHIAQADLPEILASAVLTPEMKRLVRHVVTENARTLEVAEALRRGDYAQAGAAMNAGHASLRDDYRVSCAELDDIVATAQALDGVAGCRMTGGGFGGSAVALVRTENAQACAAQIDSAYRSRYGRGVDSFVTRAAEGARVHAVG